MLFLSQNNQTDFSVYLGLSISPSPNNNGNAVDTIKEEEESAHTFPSVNENTNSTLSKSPAGKSEEEIRAVSTATVVTTPHPPKSNMSHARRRALMTMKQKIEAYLGMYLILYSRHLCDTFSIFISLLLCIAIT